jgi:hypothetical protein
MLRDTNSSMIRKATVADVEQILAFLMRVKPRTAYATIAVDKERARRTVRQCVGSPQAYAKIVVRDGDVRGVLLGIKEELWFSARREAKDIVLACDVPAASCALVDDFKAWAWSDPRVVHVILAQSSGLAVDGMDRWMPKMGFARVGSVWCVGRWDEQSMRVAV